MQIEQNWHFSDIGQPMKTEDIQPTATPTLASDQTSDWARGNADADADRPPDRDGSAAYWKGYIAACFKDARHG
ncbi:hypothetical protein GBZ48_31625 [Azospirillum melinis]|uniref:Uncharacterized protein n=1 Tax=Azospirillum melinis TaxID=328839 RepID=A0ABX2KJI1_9PROT|nr:hypothetical protein [Azospirillum melinis]MBP2310473.1 hypothetical protein [Azospirillum melinis]NUB03767.1 hypothetical protein [Azospirillum melinis]